MQGKQVLARDAPEVPEYVPALQATHWETRTSPVPVP